MITGTVAEGKTSYHAYSLLKEDGVTLVDSLEALKYKLSDGCTDLVPWTELPLDSSGTIVIPGVANRVTKPALTRRYLTVFAVHNGGDHLPETVEYVIIKTEGVNINTVPTE